MSETPETESATAAAPGRAPGEILQQAREGKNLSVAAIATQLNLDLRTVEALERGEHDRLPAPIFVRGYLRGYARLVGVPEDEVLSAYRAHAPQPEPAPRPIGGGSPPPRRPALRVPLIPWRGLFMAALLIAVAALVFVYGPRLVAPLLTGSDAPSDEAAAPSLPLPAPVDEAAPANGEEPLPASGVSGALELPLPAPQPVPAEAPPPPEHPEPEPEFPAAEDFAPAAPAAEPEAMAAPEPVAAPVPSADAVRLEFRFLDDSWVEVRGADRARLLFGLMRKGDVRSVSGKAPVSVLLGNAQAVELQVDGARFDPAPHTRNNVARFQIRAAN